ncbi:MAG TPA: PepSY-associated TM helix domain-containing protein [Usitatibacter sp.]|jgi:vanillate O-demethylase ferredoxin subunit|nr:PepSY-associated TM helix domain-containing protein [Usitatibacter sp.]
MKSARESVLIVHRWTGLTVGIVLMAVALTGLSMVFRPQLEPRLERALNEVATCSQRMKLDDLADRAHAAHPHGAIRQVELAHGAYGATVLRFVDNMGVYIDPCSGRVLGMQDRWGGVFGTIEYLHRLRFLHNTDLSETVLGTLSLTLAFVMVVGGLVAWWPSTRRQWKNAWKLRWKLNGAAFELNLHRTYGAYAAIVILAATLASLTFVFDWARTVAYTVTGSAAPPRKPHSAQQAGDPASLEQYLGKTLATVPDAADITLVLPKKKGDAVEATIIEREAPHPNARTMLYLDAHTADVLRFEPYAKASPGFKACRWLASLHMGYIGGVFGQILLFAGILAVPVLGFTGIRAWLRRRAPQAERRFIKQTA